MLHFWIYHFVIFIVYLWNSRLCICLKWIFIFLILMILMNVYRIMISWVLLLICYCNLVSNVWWDFITNLNRWILMNVCSTLICWIGNDLFSLCLCSSIICHISMSFLFLLAILIYCLIYHICVNCISYLHLCHLIRKVSLLLIIC